MLKWLLNLFFVFIFLFVGMTAWAEQDDALENPMLVDQAEMVSMQIDLLKNRLAQANNEGASLQRQKNKQLTSLLPDHVNKQLLESLGLNVSIAQSNLDTIDIELSEAQQTISRLEKHIQDIENQLNILNIFGLKISRNGAANIASMRDELQNQTHLLNLEKSRSDYLQKLKDAANNTLRIHQAVYRHIEVLLKSRSMMRVREEQARSEVDFQREQTYWLQQLNTLYEQLRKAQSAKWNNPETMSKLDSEIFFANENITLTYLKTMIARYQDQIQQYKISITRSNSIGLLNKISDQTQSLGKDVTRIKDLLKDRLTILNKRKLFLSQENVDKNRSDLTGLASIDKQYQMALVQVSDLDKQLAVFRSTLDQALQQELSSRQGIPGFGSTAWLDLGEQMLWIPTLSFQVAKSLVQTSYHAMIQISFSSLIILSFLEIAWILVCYFLYRYLANVVSTLPDHALGHINLKWLWTKVLHRNLIDIALFINIFGLFSFFNIPWQNMSFLIYLGIVWIFFKALLVTARLVLIETVHDHAGQDVRLYCRFKWIFSVGGIVAALTLFLYQLPIIYEVRDLFMRLFLLYLLVASAFFLRSWYIVPGLLLPFIDERHKDLKKIVRLLGVVIPLMLFSNAALGLLGYVNLVMTVAWYESVFLFVLVGYLIVRGLLIDAMEFISRVLIRHVTNGWLWTEAFLKPLDKILRVLLFLIAWAVLFLIYGWDPQSPVVERLYKLLYYHLVSVLNTTITPLSILEVSVVIFLLLWAARWTREFVYRLLLSRTKDLGLRNSIAILTQYATVATGVFICLAVLGIDFRALAVVASAFALGIGWGLRDLFNNFVCGFLLLIERPLRVGDLVTINEMECEVVHIGSRAVTVRTEDHMELFVPNTEIFGKNFINWTVRDNIVRVVFPMSFNFTDNPEEIQKITYEVLATHKDVLKEPKSEVFIRNMLDGSIKFEVRFYVNIRQVVSRTSVCSEVFSILWKALEAHHIKPSYPHREILIKNLS